MAGMAPLAAIAKLRPSRLPIRGFMASNLCVLLVPLVFPPGLLSVIRDRGPCDL